MHALPHRPARGNWIWLPAAAVSVIVLAVTGLNVGGGCPAAASRSPQPSQPPGATPVVGTGPAGASGGAAPASATGTPPAPGGDGPDRGQASPPAPPGSTASSAPTASGLALFYDPGAAVGSCELGPFPAGGLYAGLPPQQYDGGAVCGTYLNVRGPRGQVQVEVVDLCPTCSATMINLSRSAFARIADLTPGSARVAYSRPVDPRLPGPITIRTMAGSLPGAVAVQILNHGNPLTAVEVGSLPPDPTTGADATTWHPLTIAANDYWTSPASIGSGPFEMRIFDDRGHRVVLRDLALTPGTTLSSEVWMYAARPRPATSPAAPRPTSPASAPAPSPHC